MVCLQVLSEQTAITLKSTALAGCTVQVMLMSCSAKYLHWQLQNGHTLLSSLPLKIGSMLKDSYSIHERRSSVHIFTGKDQVHA